MAEKKVTARLQRVVKSLNEPAPALFGEIYQHVHAEDHVHAADVNRRRQIHLCKRYQLPNSGLYLMPAMRRREVCLQLLRADARETSSRVHSALRALQGNPPDVGSQNF